jgi:hypothetical protein
MKDLKDIVLPIVHSNGSGRQALMDQQHQAVMAIQAAIAALMDSMPHGRDYYPLGDDVHHRAYLQAMERVTALQKVQAEVCHIYTNLLPL